MWVTLEQLYTGVTKYLPFTRKVPEESGEVAPCKVCDAKGFIVQVIRMGPMVQQVQQPCPKCGGTGESANMKSEREVLEVFVEKGSPDGHKITLHGKADQNPGCDPGDVIIVVKLQDHPRFLRRDADLFIEQEISLGDALTGFRIKVPHLDGRTLVVCSKPGEVLQPRHGGVVLKAVPSGGMPIHQDPFSFGNLFLVISIKFPRSIDPAAAAELRALLCGEEAGEDGLEVSSPQSGGAPEIEEVFCEDMDPLESAKKKVTSAQAYEEDRHGMQGIECPQQ